jgi:hypothetical protein
MGKLAIALSALIGMVAASGTLQAQESYPVCVHPGQDRCQNAGEGGAPGRSRAADYPGGPAVYAHDAGDYHHHYGRHHAKHHVIHRKPHHKS